MDNPAPCFFLLIVKYTIVIILPLFNLSYFFLSSYAKERKLWSGLLLRDLFYGSLVKGLWGWFCQLRLYVELIKNHLVQIPKSARMYYHFDLMHFMDHMFMRPG